MKHKFGYEDIKNVEDFEAITQGETEIIEMLLKNVNECNSKVIGFVKTRKYLLKNKFNEHSCLSLASIGKLLLLSEKDSDLEMKMNMAKNLVESITRQSITKDMAIIIAKTSSILLEQKYNNDENKFIESVKKYLVENCGKSIYRTLVPKAEFIVEKGGVV